MQGATTAEGSTAALWSRAVADFGAGRYARALAAFERLRGAAALDPRYRFQLHDCISVCWHHLGDWPRAMEFARRALSDLAAQPIPDAEVHRRRIGGNLAWWENELLTPRVRVEKQAIQRVRLRWDREHTEALPPEPLRLAYPFLQKPAIPQMPPGQRAEFLAATGYRVQPGDCYAVRVLAHYGYLIRCPGDVCVTFGPDGRIDQAQASPWRGTYVHAPSGTILAPLLNSGFLKLICGLRVYFPQEIGIYLGPLPNHHPQAPAGVEVWAGISIRDYHIAVPGGLPGYHSISCNVVWRPMPGVGAVRFGRGDPVGVIYPVLNPAQFELEPLDGLHDVAARPGRPPAVGPMVEDPACSTVDP